MIADLYRRLNDLNVVVRIAGENLDIRAPKGRLDKNLLEEIKSSKEALIRFIRENRKADGAGDTIIPCVRQDSYPVSPAQRRLWILCQSEKASVAYNMSGAYVFAGKPDQSVLQRACSEVIARHESLRTVFREDGHEEVRQIIRDKTEVDTCIRSYDLRMEADPDLAVRDLIQACLDIPFNLEDSLFRISLYRLPEDRWIFVYVIHHLISDGWSMDVLIGEITAIYNAYLKGEGCPLTPLRVQYRDYVVWQRERIVRAAAAGSYWRRQLQGQLPVLQLPADKIRPAIKTYNGDIVRRQLAPLLVKGFKNLCQRQGATLLMGLLAAVNALFYRYSGHEDIIIGSPVSGREHADLEGQIGLYANTVALRTRFNGPDSFLTLIDRVRQVVAEAFEHQLYPFDQLVEELRLPRDMSRNPLFDAQVILQNAGGLHRGMSQNLEGLEVKAYDGATRLLSVFDLVLLFIESADGLEVRFIYNSDVFGSDDITRMWGHLELLLQAIVRDPQQPVCRLEYQDDLEKMKLLGKEVTAPWPGTILDLFERQVSSRPARPAVVFAGSTLTYQELNEHADRLAAFLTSKGLIGKEEKIGVMQDRSDRLVISILGILKAGGVYVPILPDYPRSRKEFILRDAGVNILLTQTEYIFDLDYFGGTIVAVDVQQDEFELTGGVPESVEASQLAYVIYTSGSTGQPKGVMIEHGAFVNGVRSLAMVFGIGPDEKFLQFYSISFDVSIFEIFAALISGAILYIIEEDKKKSPELLESFLLQQGIVTAPLPPAYLPQLNVHRVPSLTKLILGGEPPPFDKVMAFSARGIAFNSYGPTESTVCVTVYRIDKDTSPGSGTFPIGTPIPGARIYVLDEWSGLCPVGVTGEICIGGPGLARGYLNQPRLTMEKFGPDPFRPGERIYRTGDLGKWQSDGNLAFVGRRDEQVKIRGHRIEPDEIGTVLQACDGVEAAVVLARTNDQGERELVAYFTEKRDLPVMELRNWLADHLPAYMLPAHFVKMDQWPLTSNGKIDRRQLPDPVGAGLSSGTDFVAPRGEPERQLVSVFEEVLKKQPVGIQDDFFLLGGDSIKSIQVVSRLKQRGYSVSIQDVLLHPVVGELAGHLSPARRSIPQDMVRGEIPLGPVQVLFFKNACLTKHHYNQSVLLRSRAPVSEVALRASLERLVLHHDALRMVCRRSGENWVLENRDARQSYGMEVVEGLAQEGRLAYFDRIQSGFDLEEGPLFRVCLVRDKAGDLLLLAAHHLVMDGVSWRILLEDLILLYGQSVAGMPVALPLKTDSFRYWQQMLQGYSVSRTLAREDAYWRDVCSEKVDALPVDYPEGSNLEQDIATVSFTLDQRWTGLLLRQCYKAYRTEINDILLTAIGIAVAGIYEIDCIAVRVEGHGREDIGSDLDITRTVGWFTSVYPVVLRMHDRNDRIRQLIEVKENLHRVPNRGIGYGALHYLAGKDYPLKQEINFNYLGEFGAAPQGGEGSDLWEFSSEAQGKTITGDWQRDILLDFTGIIMAGSFRLAISYSSRQYSPATMQRLISACRQELESLITGLSGTEKARLTPVDLTYKGLTIDQWQQLCRSGDLEDIYPLSPLQEDLYFQWLLSPRSPIFFGQISYRVEGRLDMDLLQRAYQALVDRHGVLRTTFTRDYAERPLQIVWKEIRGHFHNQDISADPLFSIESFRTADREKGFDLQAPSPMRLEVLDLGGRTYEFIWSHHHIIMDGWCTGILIREFFRIYNGLLQGTRPMLDKPEPYSSYIEWLEKMDREAGYAWWRNYLDGYESLSSLSGKGLSGMGGDAEPKGMDAAGEGAPERLSFCLEKESWQRIQELCREIAVTENTFVQVTWALLLAWYSRRSDVVFGAVVSGRPAQMKGIEEMIGLFINTIPVRIRITPTATVRQLMKEVQEAYVAGIPYHFTQLAVIQAQSALKSGIFDHAIAFENYPVRDWIDQGMVNEQQLSCTLSTDPHDVNNFDLSLTVIPGNALTFKFVYSKNAYSPEFIAGLRDRLIRIIGQITGNHVLTADGIEYFSQSEKLALSAEYEDRTSDFNVTHSEEF
jgi:amino acid adenylation domain-containing protein/non-ribosomal peptide synthase protein (TIGR01720 family)